MENKNLEAKMDQFIPGWPENETEHPTLHYQVLLGRVYSLLRFPNESVAHGEITLADLAGIAGQPIVKEGWYSSIGDYIGTQLPGSVLDD